MIDYIGDLSRADAAVLAALASRAFRILEFGAGASTQIFSVYGAGVVHSVETDPGWIAKTTRNLARFPHGRSVTFHDYDTFLPEPVGYDLVFVDGVDELRAAFAFCTWGFLDPRGVMAFHDTRRTVPHGLSLTSDVENVCELLRRHPLEVDRVEWNRDDSNTTVVAKRRTPLVLEDWNAVEGRTLAQIGLE